MVHDTQEQRPRLRREGAALAIAGGSLAFLFLSLFLVALLPLFGAALEPGARAWLAVLRWPLLALLFLVYLGAVYRIAPAEPPRRFRWISVGALVALALWLAATGLFSLYLEHVGGFGAYYGSATGPVVLMTWLFLSAWVVMIGAEVNEQIVETREGAPRENMKERLDRA
ncbi:MAG: YhjD/YihY/BrkB family envelope integrity protein [Allosphingosinicella sp.]